MEVSRSAPRDFMNEENKFPEIDQDRDQSREQYLWVLREQASMYEAAFQKDAAVGFVARRDLLLDIRETIKCLAELRKKTVTVKRKPGEFDAPADSANPLDLNEEQLREITKLEKKRNGRIATA